MVAEPPASKTCARYRATYIETVVQIPLVSDVTQVAQARNSGTHKYVDARAAAASRASLPNHAKLRAGPHPRFAQLPYPLSWLKTTTKHESVSQRTKLHSSSRSTSQPDHHLRSGITAAILSLQIGTGWAHRWSFTMDLGRNGDCFPPCPLRMKRINVRNPYRRSRPIKSLLTVFTRRPPRPPRIDLGVGVYKVHG